MLVGVAVGDRTAGSDSPMTTSAQVTWLFDPWFWHVFTAIVIDATIETAIVIEIAICVLKLSQVRIAAPLLRMNASACRRVSHRVVGGCGFIVTSFPHVHVKVAQPPRNL